MSAFAFIFARSVSHVQVLFAMVLRVFVQTDEAMRRKSRAGHCTALPESPCSDEAATDKLGTATSFTFSPRAVAKPQSTTLIAP